jgi:hypothetical protein
MEFTGAGGGIMLALAAGLWLAYLVPNWLRRKEFNATERNAVRLSQTIRVLAETSAPQPVPVPQVAVDAPPVRAGTTPTAPRPEAIAVARERAVASSAQRVRRSRAIASLVLLAGVITTVVQVLVAVSTGWSIGGVLVLGLGGVLVVSSVTLLRRLAAVRPGAAAAPRMQRTRTVLPDIDLPSEPEAREWTPVPVPKPRVRPQVAPSTMSDPRIAAAAAAEEERRARIGADREVAPLPASRPQEAAPPAAARPSRFASMGVVDDGATALPDLDEVLARRRA